MLADRVEEPALVKLVRSLHALILEAPAGTPVSRTDDQSLVSLVAAHAPLLSRPDVDRVVERLQHHLFGLGPLELLLADPSATEIMVNGSGPVWVERNGQTEPTDVLVDDAMLRVIIDRIVGPLGRRVDRTSPFSDARLPDGSRVHIAVPPLALDGPYITIRRFRPQNHMLADFASTAVVQILTAAVHDRRNIVVAGATGAGKTSLLNALAASIPDRERVVTIEDAAELRLPGAHVVRLESRPPNAEGVGGCSTRTLVRNALRMRPDRLIVGEVRGAEAFDMIQALNTGHTGSMSTCHANSPHDALRRIESMMMMADVAMPVEVVRQQVISSIALVVFVARGEGGVRRVESVYECRGDRWLVSPSEGLLR